MWVTCGFCDWVKIEERGAGMGSGSGDGGSDAAMDVSREPVVIGSR
jgi:hypothetical protein